MRCTLKHITCFVLIWLLIIMAIFLSILATDHHPLHKTDEKDKVFQRLKFHREFVNPDTRRLNPDAGIEIPLLPKVTLHHVLVSNHYKTLFCYVPKVACTNWKSVFLVLEGLYNTTDKLNGSYVHSLEIDSLKDYPKIEVDRMLQTYKKIVFVREPMERILSAYLNKFAEDKENRKYHHRYGMAIIQKYRKNFTGEVTDEQYTTFNEFVKYLIDLQPYEKHDEHWNLQYNLCSPNNINYDFIGKYDTLKSDAARALEFMGANDVIALPDTGKLKPERQGRRGRETKTLMKTYYSMISDEEFNQLLKVYDKDYETFGFRKPSYQEVIFAPRPGNKTNDITRRLSDE